MNISEEIVAGYHDKDLDILQDAIRIRRETTNALANVIARAQLKVGDTVILHTPTMRPKYLDNMTGTIQDLKSTDHAGVSLDSKRGVWNIPYHCLEKLTTSS